MIKFTNAGKIYPNGVEALKNVSLEIEQGEFVAVIGLSGAGKSTLIRLINKMHDITSGTLQVNGIKVDESLKGKSLRKFRRSIGMIFQSFNLVKRTTVIKNVLAARVADMNILRVMAGAYKKTDKIMALTALEQLGILEKAYMRVDQLSGGQMQRVALARTIAQDPKIILADEPVASLDPITANQVMSDFSKVNKELNITVIANMHHVDMALKYAHRVVGIHEGEIVFDGPSEQVTNDILKMVYGRDLTDDDILDEDPIMDRE
ncbi:MAG: phosphonate ABC transporter ATP-binding protein [Bacilli bacterium]|nr:phosphonate ABC transporter ATP-binding protein [Bacilli bacterium]MBN2876285.1 phosphonate ABC transporter ATP-binding protein [Bacilli bacterium]